jgi:hypothetical protein
MKCIVWLVFKNWDGNSLLETSAGTCIKASKIWHIQELASTTSNELPPSQLLLNVDGVCGSGKTFTLLKTCARIQELALQAGNRIPVFRAAPTGAAAFNIVGQTLHSLFRLSIKGRKSDLSVATLQSLQGLFRDCRFLIIFIPVLFVTLSSPPIY